MKEIKLNNFETKITHPGKILFPKSGITKKHIAEYYLSVSESLLPYIENRPLTIHCFPEGVEAPGFYRQHAPANIPKYFKTATLKKTRTDKQMKHILCQNKETLLYLVNQNTIEIHRWLSKIDAPGQPDIMIIDIDPPQDRFDLAIMAAGLLKVALGQRNYNPSLMLTGSKGLHLISKVEDGKNYEQTKAMLYELTAKLSKEHPDLFSTEIRKEHRINKAYLDISRNSYGQTAIAPFSLRAKANAPIATPINWDDLSAPGLKPDSYTISSYLGHPERE